MQTDTEKKNCGHEIIRRLIKIMVNHNNSNNKSRVTYKMVARNFFLALIETDMYFYDIRLFENGFDLAALLAKGDPRYVESFDFVLSYYQLNISFDNLLILRNDFDYIYKALAKTGIINKKI